MRGGGVPYCPWWGGPWGEHGVCGFEEPLWAGGRCCSSHYVVVPALEDCNPDLWRGVVAVAGGGGRSSSAVRRLAARRAVSQVGAVACSHCSGWFGSAGWAFSAGARRGRMVSRCVMLVSVSCVRAWPHSIAGIQTCWPWACRRARQSTRSTMVSWRPLPGVVSLVQLSCRRYQARGVLRALPWRVARRRSGSRMVVDVRGVVLCVPGGAGWSGCRCPAHPRRRIGCPGWARLGWAVPGGLVGERRALGCSDGVLEACRWRWGGHVWSAEWVSGLLGHARHGNG